MIELQRYLTHLPSHDGQPPAEFGWNADCQVSFDHGVQIAQAWLDNANRAPLKTTCVAIAALKTGSKCSFTARKLRFFACFCLALAASPTFLEVPNSGWLWANLLLERQLYPPGAQRHAFELGFLSRIHQRLCSPLGGEHQALRTELRL